MNIISIYTVDQCKFNALFWTKCSPAEALWQHFPRPPMYVPQHQGNARCGLPSLTRLCQQILENRWGSRGDRKLWVETWNSESNESRTSSIFDSTELYCLRLIPVKLAKQALGTLRWQLGTRFHVNTSKELAVIDLSKSNFSANSDH